MLTQEQYDSLPTERKTNYLNLDDEGKAEFAYFWGFTFSEYELHIPTNAEIELYKASTDKIDLKTVAQLLNFTPHKGQQPIFYTFDRQREIINNIVMVLGRRTGKSISTSIVGVRELLVPYSSTILLTPTFNNAKIIFNEVLKHVQKLKMPIKNINKGAFRFELENGARFSANSEANIESALGTYNSLIIVDEAQSFDNLEHIMNQMLVPTLLDYGTRPSGILYGRQIYLGTPRGEHNLLYTLYNKQDDFYNWKSYNAPSTVNPILPQSYFEQMRAELGEMLYRQEILAEFVGTGKNVFWAYDSLNEYSDGDVTFSTSTAVIAGIDVGASDSTALVLFYRFPNGEYYLDQAYSQNMTSTSQHIANYRLHESYMLSEPELRYMDPSAAQLIIDYVSDYDYECLSAKNPVQDSIKYINQLLTPTGANNKPKLFINKRLTEVIRQVSRVQWKNDVSKTSKDPFIKDPKKTHWDFVAAIRYALYSDQYNNGESVVTSSSSVSNLVSTLHDKLKQPFSRRYSQA